MADKDKTQLAVIGGGPGGYAAAFHAADLGMDVTLIDVEANPGGTCLYRGCIPSKALLHVAKLITDAREAEEWGLTFAPPEMNLEKMRNRTRQVVDQMTGGLGQLCQARNITYERARASFLDPHTLALNYADGAKKRLAADSVIIATGSRPALFGPLIRSRRLMNSTNALHLEDIPGTLLVIGGGYIGLELGSVYAALGSAVTVAEMTDVLLPGGDRDLVVPLAHRLESRFHQIMLKTRVNTMQETDQGILVNLENEEIGKEDRLFDKVLISVGRKPNSRGLNLFEIGLEIDAQGFIPVDLQRRTAIPHIYAIGDVTGQPMLAHKASAEGKVAAENIAGRKAVFEPQAIPAVVFTDPEVAWAGITEKQAAAQGIAVAVARFPWAASGRASTMSRPEGLTKILCDPDTGQILGMGITGTNAGELISEGVLAIEMGAVVEDLDMTIHPHPTLSETVMESAAAVFGTSTHFYRPLKKK
ncbi:MAG TPA: dihydrolipoyl dehydrogenase [Candidatus Hydrogenedentes bacterium]|jgi:dihydrolipoamide dehydrogenase|nr:MAG: Dihydrolipoyl dehydrogenase [Candidatus Hydrogenedentes bacterium ADurb.Bin170]HNZ48258.1 dihydrolipoyl dehydrogenase [Candidatus Hydrogenedentota bacterium]HOD95054.1 dihydrolipoyl dehydrogenase [Candidatus Hydrogenedentota bacterium]HOR50450.1 dihydrolipoyl dehydrogenase [Candidatus Hydrogenedentota bacterium]HPK24428.1 dihydrolipoyl dehydrogenase [Candidatus Hydrogenedentota bacterium]